jgi:HSP20 family protein
VGFWFRRRRRSIFDYFLDELFREFEEEIRELEREIEEMVRRGGARGPYVYGVRITIGPDGVPRIEEFGNIKRSAREGVKIMEEMEPLVDVIDHDDEVWIVADIPGVDKDKIKVKVKEDKVVIRAEDGKKYYKEIELPSKVKPETAKAKYRNGVLEVRVKKVKPEKREEEEEGMDVKVE